jgi:hypothetical protein
MAGTTVRVTVTEPESIVYPLGRSLNARTTDAARQIDTPRVS